MERKIVLMAGATGTLGMKIVKACLAQGALVRAMVRATSNRNNLEALGISDFVVGDMMDIESLRTALAQNPKADALIASAAGYTRHTKGDSPETDTVGYRNLVDAAKEAGIPRFVFISILECDKAVSVLHFHHKYLVEEYLKEKMQPYIALRAGAFLDQAWDILPQLKKGVYPALFSGVELGMIYTPDLARYTAIAAISLPDSALGSSVDVGWETPASGLLLAEAFSKILGKPVKAKPAFPFFITHAVMPFLGLFIPGVRDMTAMMSWIETGAYVSRNPRRQEELFGELPELEEAVLRYCRDRGLA